MILDAVLDDRHCWWLSPEADKRRFFALMQDNYLRPEDYPHITFGSGRERVIRCFPDKLPIGVEKGRTDHLVLLYLVNRRIPVDFRQFLIRHAGLLQFVHTWTLRLLVPRRFRKAVSLYQAAVREELWTPMNPSVTKLLETCFAECQSTGAHVVDPTDPYIRREFRRQGNANVQALYRAWRRQGDGVIWDAHSSTLADDRARGCSTVEVEPLNRQYLQLSGAMDRDAWAKKGGQAKIGSGWSPCFGALTEPSLPLG